VQRKRSGCLTGFTQNIDGGASLFLYGEAFWTFFHGEVNTGYSCPVTVCGANFIVIQARVTWDPKNLYWYGVNTRCADRIIFDGTDNSKELYNPGGWSPGGVVAAYLRNSGL